MAENADAFTQFEEHLRASQQELAERRGVPPLRQRQIGFVIDLQRLAG